LRPINYFGLSFEKRSNNRMKHMHNRQIPRLEHQISREIAALFYFQNCFINFVIFEMSKRKIKQEVGLVVVFEQFSIEKRKTEQSNWYIFNE